MKHREILPLIVNTAIQAGNEICKVYNSADFKVQFKADDSPLTIADMMSNDLIIKVLQDTGYPIISEETKLTDYQERRNYRDFWLVDPLDGTKEFIQKNGQFTVNIAFISDGTPELGVIYAPFLKKLYIGTSQEGAFKAENILEPFESDKHFWKTVRKIENPVEARGKKLKVMVSLSHSNALTDRIIDYLQEQGYEIEKTNVGSSLKFCEVAEGKAFFYPRIGPTMEWDIAAGEAIVRASGGKVLQYPDFTPMKYNKENLVNPYFVVTNKTYNSLIDRLKGFKL